MKKHQKTTIVSLIALSLALTAAGCKDSTAPSPLEPDISQNNQPLQASNGLNSFVGEIAVLGDSQSTGGYGQRLSELIRYASQQKLSYFGAASSGRIGSWISGGFTPIPANGFYGCDAYTAEKSCAPSSQPGKRTEAIANIIAQHPFIDLYVITLGDNHFFDPASVKSELPRLIRPILNAGARCAFVSPTEGLGQFANKTTLISNLKAANESVRAELGRSCAFIDSYTVGKDVLKDNSDLQLMRDAVAGDPMKLHPRGSGAKLWAERVFEALKLMNLVTSL